MRHGGRDRVVTPAPSASTALALGQYLVAPHLIRPTAAHPELQVELRLTERCIDIVGDGIGLAVRLGMLDDSDMVTRLDAVHHRVFDAMVAEAEVDRVSIIALRNA
jgi:DNA-binding transcriptional LysR family regulator